MAAGFDVPDPTTDPLLGRTLKTYRLDQVLGRGGMGVVYLAYDLRLKRKVALKTIRPDIAGDGAARLRLEREARAAAALNHPAIATLLDFDQVEDVVFLVFEHLEGTTLRDLLAARRPSVAEALHWAMAIAQALKAAHARGVVHRDLKPENVMVLEGGSVKVLDFGLAKFAPETGLFATGTPSVRSHLTADGALVGTLAYMAPEQLQGGEAGRGTDVFAFGVVLYEVLAARHPFAGSTPAATIAGILRGSATPLEAIEPAVPPRLARIVHRCLQPAPASRDDSADELLSDLTGVGAEPLAAGSHVRAEPEYRLPRGLARGLFLTLQAAYLVMYAVLLKRSDHLPEAFAGALGAGTDALVGAAFLVVLLGTAVRLYLTSLVVWDHVKTGVYHERAFPFFFVLDVLWALAPLLLIERWGMLALLPVAPLAFSPFGQRTLLRSAYDHKLGRRISSGA